MATPVWQFEHSVECAAGRRAAWQFWTNVSNWERLEGDAVEWIRLDGEFAEGSRGVTKSPGQDVREWTISELDLNSSGTIRMQLGGAVFTNRMTFDSISNGRTRITQQMSLSGEGSDVLAEGMRAFEASAPQGLAKLAAAIEAAQGEFNSECTD